MLKDKYKFYITLCLELVFWPFLWLRQQFIMTFGKTKVASRFRKAVDCNSVIVNVHEWGKYPETRKKTIKNWKTFECGFKYQKERFQNIAELVITMSETDRNNVIAVSNKGMDFSGYQTVYEKFKDGPNRYIILTNSSVNAIQEDFLDGYIQYMEHNPDVGMLGVSYCTKMIQTLVRRNFTPHLQSFFLLTTIDVLHEVVRANNGKFPGAGVDHKLMLIRQGEIKISKLVQKLGYRLAVVNPINGIPYKFECYKEWKLPFGDIRQQIEMPNRITPIKNDNSFNSNI